MFYLFFKVSKNIIKICIFSIITSFNFTNKLILKNYFKKNEKKLSKNFDIYTYLYTFVEIFLNKIKSSILKGIYMKSFFTKSMTILSIAALSVSSLMAQTTTPAAPAAPAAPPAVDHSYKPMTLKLSDDGKKFIRLITWHQIWATATQNNPGTKDINGNLIDGTNNSKEWSTSLAIRRSRFLIHAQVSPRFMILSHWGINNQSFINGGANAGSNLAATGAASNNGKRPQLYMHDAWTEFAVKPGLLSIGAGLHYWNGISRLTSNSTLNFMTLDAPIFNWANIEATDQFARQFGIYAKGQILGGRLDYRLHLNKPFAFGSAAADVGKRLAKLMPQRLVSRLMF